mmetsp:Transcript_3985/g.5196  ORF Transcript_3985/g.5196 Transcript_3985/m.5196 type:complete len:1557 (+) Transcript_3985:97-4767(+)
MVLNAKRTYRIINNNDERMDIDEDADDSMDCSDESDFTVPRIHKEEIRHTIHEAYACYERGGVDALLQHIKDKETNIDSPKNNDDVEMAEEDKNDESDMEVISTARAYQVAMFDRAKEQNTIVQLNTGLGKTLIAIMTIKHFSTQYGDVNADGHSKQTLFLVPSVALVLQQAKTLRINLPYKIATACQTAAKSEEARQELSDAQIIVATHGSALELLRHYSNTFYLSRVNLIVVDECHHSIGNHSYAVIFRNYYHVLSKELRPHVLGLTASPIINIKKKVITSKEIEEKLSELESALDARVVSLTNLQFMKEEGNEVMHSNVEEKSILYEDNHLPSSNFPSHENIGLHQNRIKELNQLCYLLEQYGPVLVWKYSEAVEREISRNRYEGETENQFYILKNHLTAVSEHCKNVSLNSLNGGRSSKLIKLEELLNEQYGVNSDGSSRPGFDDNTIGIVFVQRKISAVSLKHYFCFRQIEKIRCSLLTRKTTNIFKYLSYNYKMNDCGQKKIRHSEWLHTIQNAQSVLKSLQNRDINLLFATSVVEEGIDVDACSFVVVLDELQTTKAYVQMRGRARQMQAKFYVFENTSTNAQKSPLSLEAAKRNELQISSVLESRQLTMNSRVGDSPCSSIEAVMPDSSSSSSLEEEALINENYRTRTNTIVDLISSKSIVNRYCGCIPMDIQARISRLAMMPYLPVYNDDSLELPSHLPKQVRSVQLPRMFLTESKKKNESLLALIACVRLHAHGVLSDRLLPLKRDDIQQKLRKYALTRLERVKVDLSRISPPVNGQKKQIYIYPLVQRGDMFDQNNAVLSNHRCLCIISLSPLRSEKLSLELTHTQLGSIHCLFDPYKVDHLSSEQWKICTSFYSAIMNSRWRRRTGRKRFQYSSETTSVFSPYIVACLSENKQLDWNHMKSIIDNYNRNDDERNSAAQNWTAQKPRLFAPKYDPNNTYLALTVEKTMCSAPFPNPEFDSYADYFIKIWNFRVSNDCKLVKVQRAWDLPTKSAEKIKEDNASNVMMETAGNCECDGLATIFLPIDACIEIPVADPFIMLHSIMLPQILYELERIETTKHFIQHCSQWPLVHHYLQKLPFSEVVQSMTAKSCDLVSYDRFEYLGDAVLKVLHTDALVNSHNEEFRQWFRCLHEGDLSELRTEMGCNDRLADIAKSAGFDHFIMTVPLGRGTWLSSGLETYYYDFDADTSCKVKDQNNFPPSLKVIADIIESLLGLVYLYNGYDVAMKFAVELGITSPIRSDVPQIESLEETNIEDDLVKHATEFLGRFDTSTMQNRSLFAEAFTHPTANSSNYQRLEWIGDAVLCLAGREWAFKRFPALSVKDLVKIETILVCNETLAMISFKSGLHQYIKHCDSSLPSRLEEYEFQLNKKKTELWVTDPPKVMADIVEALIGVAHVTDGFDYGQFSALNAIDSMINKIIDHFENPEGTLMNQLNSITHPITLITELSPSLKVRKRDIKGFKNTPMCYGKSGGFCSEKVSDGTVGEVSFHGLSLCRVAVSSKSSIAKSLSCSLLFSVLQESNDLVLKLEEMSKEIMIYEKKIKEMA